MKGEKGASVEARTRPDTGAYTAGPEDVWVNSIGVRVPFLIEVKGMEPGQTAAYTWQQDKGSDSYTENWVDIENDNKNEPWIYYVDVNSNDQDQTRYRVKVDIKQDTAIGTPGVVQTIYSRTAVLHISDTENHATDVELSVSDANSQPIPEYGGEYYIRAGTPLSLSAEVKKDSGDPVAGGTVSFFYKQGENTVQPVQTDIDVSTGKAAIDFTPPETGTYTFAAEFSGYDVGEHDKYKPGVSTPVILHAGRVDANYYIIDYELDGGTNAPENPAAMGHAQAVTLADPVKDYAGFTGWYTDSGLTNQVTALDGETLAALADENHRITLYAGWENTPYDITYMFIYNQQDMNSVDNSGNPASYTAYETVLLKDPQKVGYGFRGWYTDPDYKEQIYSLPRYGEDGRLLPLEPVTLYSKWEPEVYTVTYVLNGGINDRENPSTYTIDDTELHPIKLQDPIKDGARFEGWYKDALFTDTERITEIKDSGDLTLYAKWSGEQELEPFEKDENGFWLIHNLQELERMRDLINDGGKTYATDSYLLCANIYGEGAQWNIPAGTEQIPFNGQFNGYDYMIDGLVMTGTPYQGVFGVIGENGAVSNLKTINLQTDGNADNAGGIAAVNKGTIDKCGSGLNVGTSPFIHGEEITDIEAYNNEIHARILAGGLTGDNTGIITNSHSNAIVTADVAGAMAGGAAGRNIGSILNGYNTGKVQAPEGNAGGITGSNDNGTLANLYNSGSISAGLEKGGIAALGIGGAVRACYYNNSGMEALPGQSVDAQYKKGSEMKTKEFEGILNQESERAGYNKWEQLNIKNAGYPRILSNILKPNTSDSNEIQVQTLAVHPDSALRVKKLDEDSARYQELLKKAKKDKAALLAAWDIDYLFPDGYSSDTEQKIVLHLPADSRWNDSKNAVIHRIRKGVYETLQWQETKDQYVTTSEGLSTFAVFEYKDDEDVPDPDGPDKPGKTDGTDAGYLPVKKTGGVSETGDTADILLWVCLAAAAVSTAVAVGIGRRKKGRYGRKGR